MKNNKTNIIYSSIIVFVLAVSWCFASDIVVSKGKYNDYYHVEIELNSDDYELEIPIEKRLPKYDEDNFYEFSEGGQFEIFIKKDSFPIKAPKCKEYLILRMPWTSSDNKNSTKYIEEKKVIFDKLKSVKQGDVDSIKIVVELNPYCKVTKKDLLTVELTSCNIFFRQSHERYINYTGKVKKEK